MKQNTKSVTIENKHFSFWIKCTSAQKQTIHHDVAFTFSLLLPAMYINVIPGNVVYTNFWICKMFRFFKFL